MAIFFPILSYSWLSIEDTTYYSTNPLFGSASLLDRLRASWTIAPESNYMPLTWSFTILLSEVSNHSAKVFHLASLLLHLLNSGLAFLLLRRLKLTPILAGLIVLLFAIHPLRVESVAWASSLKGLLAAFFTLLTLLTLTDNSSKVSKFKEPLVILFFLLSLLCKQTLFLLPATIFLLTLIKPELRLKVRIYIILSILTGLAALTASLVNADNPMLAVHQLNEGKIAPLKALAAMGHYLQQHLLPQGLMPEYPTTKSITLIALGVIGLSPLTLWIRYLKKSNISSPEPLIYYTCFIALLLPVLGFITTPLEFAADRLTYIPSLFFWAACVLSLQNLFQSQRAKNISLTACLPLVIFYTFLSIKQTKLWRNDQTLTHHILKHSPNHFLANLQIANDLAINGKLNTALTHAELLIHSHPHLYAGWQTFTRIHISMGSAEIAFKKLDNILKKETPISTGLTFLQIEALRSLKRYPEALTVAKLALNKGADPATIHYHNALTYLQSGDPQNAQSQIQLALELNPNSPVILSLKQEIETNTK